MESFSTQSGVSIASPSGRHPWRLRCLRWLLLLHPITCHAGCQSRLQKLPMYRARQTPDLCQSHPAPIESVTAERMLRISSCFLLSRASYRPVQTLPLLPRAFPSHSPIPELIWWGELHRPGPPPLDMARMARMAMVSPMAQPAIDVAQPLILSLTK